MTSAPAASGEGPLRLIAERLFDGRRFHRNCALVVRRARVDAIEDAEHIPADGTAVRLPPGSIVAPGFVDVQVNGGGGVLFNDDCTVASLRRIAAAHLSAGGTTALLPTLITDSRERMRAAIAAASEALESGIPGIVGIHLEGPFLNPRRKGIHDPDRMATIEEGDVALLRGLGCRGVTVVTLAPEMVPPTVIATLARAGVRVCAGHTDATEGQLREAFDAGVSGFTHLYNAMSQIGPREIGAVGFALSDPRPFAGIIADGHHVGQTQIRFALDRMGRDRLMLVTDAMSPVGDPHPRSTMNLFGREIRRVGNRLAAEDGTLAGSMLDMAAAVRHMVEVVGAPLEDALVMASRTPAAFLGLEKSHGHLEPGARADIVVLDASLGLVGACIGGNWHGRPVPR